MNGTVYHSNIAQSNYTAVTLVSDLNSIMLADSFMCSYNSNTSKITITNGVYNFSIYSSSAAFSIIGMDYLNGDKFVTHIRLQVIDN